VTTTTNNVKINLIIIQSYENIFETHSDKNFELSATISRNLFQDFDQTFDPTFHPKRNQTNYLKQIQISMHYNRLRDNCKRYCK